MSQVSAVVPDRPAWTAGSWAAWSWFSRCPARPPAHRVQASSPNVTAESVVPTAVPARTWPVVWSPSATLDQPTNATMVAPASSTGPNTMTRTLTEPAETAVWTDIFQNWLAIVTPMPTMNPAATMAMSWLGARRSWSAGRARSPPRPARAAAACGVARAGRCGGRSTGHGALPARPWRRERRSRSRRPATRTPSPRARFRPRVRR